MKTLLFTAAAHGTNTLFASAGAIASPTSDAAQGWLWIAGANAAVSLSTLIVNFILIRNRNRPVEISQPILTEARKEFATKDDVAKAKAFTGRSQADCSAEIRALRENFGDELRRIYDQINPLATGLAAASAKLGDLDQDLREIRAKIS